MTRLFQRMPDRAEFRLENERIAGVGIERKHVRSQGVWGGVMKTIVLLVLAPALFAQNAFKFDISGEWRYQAGDRSDYASHDYNDSAWQSRRLPGGRPRPLNSEIYWLRRSVSVPAAALEHPLSLTIGLPDDVYELFVNGRRLPTPTTLDSLDKAEIPRARSYDLPAEVVQTQPMVIALRLRSLYFPPNWRFRDAGPYEISSRNIAPREAGRLQLLERFANRSPRPVIGAALAMLGLFALVFWFTFRERTELLWFAGWMFTQAILAFAIAIPLATQTHEFNRAGAAIFVQFLIALTHPLGASFALRVLSQTRLWVWILPWAAALVYCVTQLWFVPTPYNPDHVGFVAGICVIGSAAWNWRRFERWPERLLFVSLLFTPLAQVWLLAQVSSAGAGGAQREISLGAFSLPPLQLGNLPVGILLVLLMVWRSAADRREKERLATEIDSARKIQQLLLPVEAAQSENWMIEASYRPAREVGGDFYQVADRADGSRIIVVGDVSGKGLEAAMMASVAVGAFRSADTSSPAEVLEIMNRALTGHGRSGFVTCVCVRFHGDGVTLASAGHPAPWCDGIETHVAAGLPLGIDADAAFQESAFHGRRFTFVSDGVMEAINPQGELFGFERTAAISVNSAEEIAETARAWGQNDDITVVTVQRLAKAEATA